MHTHTHTLKILYAAVRDVNSHKQQPMKSATNCSAGYAWVSGYENSWTVEKLLDVMTSVTVADECINCRLLWLFKEQQCR